METQSESSSQEPFETHCVIELSTKCNADFVEWMIQRIQSPKSQGGAELLVRSVRDVNTNQYAFLHICAPTYRLLMIAEWLELMKPDMQDNEALREFTVKTLSRFVPEGGYPGDLFDYAEKARMVYFEIHELRAKDDETDRFYKTDKIRFSVGQSIITKIQRKDLINQIFSLHEKEVLKLLSKDWISLSFSKKQPLDRIRAYFGEHIAIYFAFLGYYTEMLVPATILGFSMFFLQWFSAGSLQSTAAFAIFNVLWATFFFERWKRYCNRLSYKWGVLNKTNQELELPRAQFKGSMGKNPVTGQPEPVYSVVQRNIWIGLVSAPVVTLCLFLTLYILGTYLHTQLRLSEEYLKNPTIMLFFGKFAPSAVYTICINIFRSVYKYIATWLTDKENHRLQTSYEFHLIWKLLLFNFINSFSSLFYIAFWLQDLDLLRSHLAAQLITNQILDQFPETLMPYAKVQYEKWRLKRELRNEQKKRTARGENVDPNFEALRDQATIESELPEYLGTFDDYLELFLQFGYCFLFSSAFPIAALFALINNVIEIRGDGFKLCNIMQRPFARPANSIGPWQLAFELMGFAAVTTNLALIYVSPPVHEYFSHASDGQLIMAFVVIEHLLIFAKLGMTVLIPTVPRDVAIAMAKTEYDMKLAVKERRAQESRKEIEAQIQAKRWSRRAVRGDPRQGASPSTRSLPTSPQDDVTFVRSIN